MPSPAWLDAIKRELDEPIRDWDAAYGHLPAPLALVETLAGALAGIVEAERDASPAVVTISEVLADRALAQYREGPK